jgi:Nickel responsive protein SCO4226-like
MKDVVAFSECGNHHDRASDQRRSTMPKFVIEREIPGAGKLSPQDLKGISQKSCGVLRELGPDVQWVESYVTDDKVYCVYLAPNEEAIREHARRGGFPANRISAVRRMIDPTTAE